jgi:cell division cycle 2-like protein
MNDERINEKENKIFLGRKRYPNLDGSRSIDNFEHIGKIDEGAYGVVYKARDKETGEIVAIKKVKLGKEKEGFPITSIREINILMMLSHENIMKIKEVVFGNTQDKIFCVMEYADFELKSILSEYSCTNYKRIFSLSQLKCLFYQVLKGVEYIHKNWIMHRDLKTSNILYSKNGILKIGDFGLARKFGNPLKPYTQLVVTLWYRAPELLLNIDKYGTSIDIWSSGCILAELFLGEPLFQGEDEIDQLHKIFKILGTPDEKIWPGWKDLPNVKRINFNKNYSNGNLLREKFPKISYEDDFVLTDKGFDLLKRLLNYNPDKRISAEQALLHPWFIENPQMSKIDQMPTLENLVFKEKNKTSKKKLKSLNEEQIKQREKLHNLERYDLEINEQINKDDDLENNKIELN